MVGSDKHFPYLGRLFGLFSGQGVNQDEPKVDPFGQGSTLFIIDVYVILRRCRYKVIS